MFPSSRPDDLIGVSGPNDLYAREAIFRTALALSEVESARTEHSCYTVAGAGCAP